MSETIFWHIVKSQSLQIVILSLVRNSGTADEEGHSRPTIGFLKVREICSGDR